MPDTPAQTAQAQWDAFKAATASFRGPCVECVHKAPYGEYYQEEGAERGEHLQMCRHPLVCVPVLKRVSGELSYPLVPCRNIRKEGAVCGPEGVLFEPKPKWPGRLIDLLKVLMILLMVGGVVSCIIFVDAPK